MEFQPAGRTALVTGAGSGIGRAIAFGLLGVGVDVGLIDLVPERVESALAEAEPFEARAYGVSADVSLSADVQRAVSDVERQLGPVDILVNCVGIFPRSAVAEMAEDEWDRVLATNLKSVFLLCRAVLPGMLSRQHGRIVSITSGLGVSGAPRGSHYAASKAAINGFTRSLAGEVKDRGINVNAIAPGLTDTPMMRGANSEEYIASLARSMPGGRLGQPEDVVGTALFLTSNLGEHLTGQIVNMRG